jgi:hypothetical protein
MKILQRKRFHFAESGELYLTRYVLLECRWGAVLVHRFHASDVPPYHDHPWDFASIVLWGGYIEHMRNGPSIPRRMGSVALRRAEDAHLVELTKNPTWTLILKRAKRRTWGFFRPDGWVPFYKHIR